jgi:hypothetical protein
MAAHKSLFISLAQVTYLNNHHLQPANYYRIAAITGHIRVTHYDDHCYRRQTTALFIPGWKCTSFPLLLHLVMTDGNRQRAIHMVDWWMLQLLRHYHHHSSIFVIITPGLRKYHHAYHILIHSYDPISE